MAYKLEGASYTGTKQQYLKYFYTDFNMFAKTLEYYILIQNTLKAKIFYIHAYGRSQI